MIASNSPVLTVESTVKGDVAAMTVDQAAMGHIMSILTDMYSDAEMAVIREYTTNGRDSHVEAGVDRPVEVFTPTQLSPFFRVKDYGVGLAPQDIHDIYSKYGASTKRNTNDQVGMLGIGCKSALSYATQFTLTAVKDGVRTVVQIAREQDGSGAMTVVDTSATDEPNGVEVTVPARRDNAFEAKAKKFFAFWPVGTVKLNGADVTPRDGLKVTDTITLEKVSDPYAPNARQDVLVMGNVPYPTTERVVADLNYNYRVVATVPIGSLDIHPSREALRDTPHTLATVARVRDEFDAAARDIVQRRVDEANSRGAAIVAYLEWREVIPTRLNTRQAYTYRGEDLPTEFKNPDKMITVQYNSHIQSRYYTGTTIGVESWPSTGWVVGYDPERKWTAPRKRKLKKYAEDNGITGITTWALMQTDPRQHIGKWLDNPVVIQWEKVNAVKLDRTPSPRTGRIPGSYEAYVDGQYVRSHPAADIDTTKPLFYMLSSDANHDSLLANKYPQRTVVQFPSTRKDKFLRLFPQAIRLSDVVDKVRAEEIKRFTQLERDALALHDHGSYYSHRQSEGWRDLSALDASKVDDPDLKAAVKLTTVDLKPILAVRDKWRRWSFSTAELVGASFENPLDKYPLAMVRYHPEDTYIYINAAYAARQKGAN